MMENADSIFKNPDKQSLEMVHITISNNGVNCTVPALSKHFVEERYFLHYERPQFFVDDGTEIIGAKDRWIEITTYLIDDLKWLRGLPYFKFWSNIVYNTNIKQSVVTFLQEAPQYYDLDSFPKDKEANKLLNALFENVLVIFARLITNDESPIEFMDKEAQGKLLYDNYIFSVPIIFDLCQHYGRENQKVVAKILDSVFKLQPLYLEDVRETLPYIVQIFRNIEQRFEDCPIPLAGETVKLIERGGAPLEISEKTLQDIILHLLDTVSTIKVFLENYSTAISIFKNDQFITKLVSIYANAIPEMYKKLLFMHENNETDKFDKLKHLLDVTRVEILHLFRTVIYEEIGDVLESTIPFSEEEVKTRVDSFIELLCSTFSQTNFMIDYINLFPIDLDIDILMHICPTVDQMKIDYINQIVSLEHNDLTSSQSNSVPNTISQYVDIPEEKLVSLIAEVKDILCDMDETYIMKCLRYYNYNSESVINAALENNLPPEIKFEDMNIAEETRKASTVSDTKTENLNNNPENFEELCDEVTRAITSIGINGKKMDYKYENVAQMLDDKSFVRQNNDFYNNYSLVEDVYEDEYDDTYDDGAIEISVQDDIVEVDRPFTMPRVLMKHPNQQEAAVEYEDELEENTETKSTADHFVQDPAKLRALAEQRRLSKREKSGKGGPREKDVTGKPKGQGQDNTVLLNRNQKNVHKSSQGNHNRRAGSSWKKRQGMVPS